MVAIILLIIIIIFLNNTILLYNTQHYIYIYIVLSQYLYELMNDAFT